AGAGLAILAKRPLELLEEIGLRAEMAEVLVAAFGFLRHFLAHRGAGVAVEGIALDIGRGHLLAAEDLLEGLLDRSGAGPRGARDGDDGMATRHWGASAKQSAAAEQRRGAVLEQGRN